MHPQVWKVSGHYDLFHDFMVDCRESKHRYRHDQVQGRWAEYHGKRVFITSEASGAEGEEERQQKALKFFNLRSKKTPTNCMAGRGRLAGHDQRHLAVLGPDAKTPGTLTEPREFNLMFESIMRGPCRTRAARFSSAPKRPRASSSTSRTCWTAPA